VTIQYALRGEDGSFGSGCNGVRGPRCQSEVMAVTCCTHLYPAILIGVERGKHVGRNVSVVYIHISYTDCYVVMHFLHIESCSISRLRKDFVYSMSLPTACTLHIASGGEDLSSQFGLETHAHLTPAKSMYSITVRPSPPAFQKRCIVRDSVSADLPRAEGFGWPREELWKRPWRKASCRT
jgi:hypothetical protein